MLPSPVVPECANGGSPFKRGSVPEVIVSLLGCRLNIAVPSPIWPLLVVAGLLTVPAECARIGHPHSLFQGISAAPSSPPSHEEGPPHSAVDHVHAESGYLPAWASPFADIASLSASSAYHVSVAPGPPGDGCARHIPGSSLPPAAGDLPVIEPAAPAAFAAFGTALALLAALMVLLLPGRPRETSLVAPLSSLLARALDPPPPRAQILAW